ncbi:hypothetical protein IV203_020439 [Nitzschia inconspicua]|uniref:Uncharacterized protein n=1 Tax=Nitzschia inconspicua TaxID=303405 RepID=A0A9K3K915_9STRA|nr:hypothetical protein IV203_020439 [Nitzschia inconspicua]
MQGVGRTQSPDGGTRVEEHEVLREKQGKAGNTTLRVQTGGQWWQHMKQSKRNRSETENRPMNGRTVSRGDQDQEKTKRKNTRAEQEPKGKQRSNPRAEQKEAMGGRQGKDKGSKLGGKRSRDA